MAGHQAAHHVGGEQLLQRRGRELGGHEAVAGAGQGEDGGHGGDGHGEQHHGHPRAGGGHTGQQAGDGAHPPPQTSVGYTNLSSENVMKSTTLSTFRMNAVTTSWQRFS